MRKDCFRGIAIILLLLLSSVCVSNDAVRLAISEDRPEIKGWLGSMFDSGYDWKTRLSVHLRLIRGESEGFLVLLDRSEANALISSFEDSGKGIKLSLFRVEYVALQNGTKVPDPLIPIAGGGTVGDKDKQLLYVKVTTSPSVPPGRYKEVIKFLNQDRDVKVSITIDIEVLPISIPEETQVTIQGSVWSINAVVSQDKKGDIIYVTEKIKELLRLMSEYRVNGVAGMLDASMIGKNVKIYREIVKFALDDLHFRRVRLPIKRMYNWKNPMSSEYADKNRPDEASLIREYSEYLLKFQPIMDEPKWAGRLGFKIWDEPREKDYPDVVLTYRAAKKVAPALKLELSEQPEPQLQNVADVWMLYIKFLRPEDIEEQHRLGKEVWIYANKVHGIDHPLYGMRILGWLLWKYNLDGYLFWAINWWKEDPWETVSSQKKDFLKRGTLVYPDPKTGKIYPSLRLEAFRDGIEDMLLLREVEKVAQGNGPKATKAKTLLLKLKNVYSIAERYDNAPNPAVFREEVMKMLF